MKTGWTRPSVRQSRTMATTSSSEATTAGAIVTGTGGGPGGPGGAWKVRNQRAIAASRIETAASSIRRLCILGLWVFMIASTNTTAKNAMPLIGTMEKPM